MNKKIASFFAVCLLGLLLSFTRPASAMFGSFNLPNPTTPAGIPLARVQGTGTNYVDSKMIVNSTYALWTPTNTPTGYYSSFLYYNCGSNENTFASQAINNGMNIAYCPMGTGTMTYAWVIVVAW